MEYLSDTPIPLRREAHHPNSPVSQPYGCSAVVFWIDLDAAGKRSHDQIVSEANVTPEFLWVLDLAEEPEGTLERTSSKHEPNVLSGCRCVRRRSLRVLDEFGDSLPRRTAAEPGAGQPCWIDDVLHHRLRTIHGHPSGRVHPFHHISFIIRQQREARTHASERA